MYNEGSKIRFTINNIFSRRQQFNEWGKKWENLYDPWIACKCGFASQNNYDFLKN